MKKELKDKWVAALRSGDYKQTTEVLKNDCGFCCLGVLCDITPDLGVWSNTPSEFNDAGGYDFQFVNSFADATEIPWNVADDNLGINNSEGHSLVNDLMTLNDTDNKSFAEIADFIETTVVED